MVRIHQSAERYLAHRCLHEFSPQVRQRGITYFRIGRVFIDHANSEQVHARVFGSHQNMYHVLLEHTDNHRREDLAKLGAHCTCPAFDDGPCKHIYAAMLFVDDDGSFAVPGTDPIKLRRISVRHPHSAAVAFPRQSAPPQPWEDFLSRVHQTVAVRPRAPSTGATPTKEIRYSITSLRYPSGMRAWVNFYTQRLKSDGTPAKPKPLRISADSLLHQPEPDQTLISRMRYGSGYTGSTLYDYDDGATGCKLGPELYDVILQPLCDTGRLFASPDLQGSPLSWNGGSAYRFVLQLAAEGKALTVSGGLVRDEQTIAVSEIDWLTTDGLFVHDNKLAQVAPQGMPWLAGLSGEPVIIVPKAARDRFIREAFSGCDAEIDLDPALGWSITHAPPVPFVRIQRSPGMVKRLEAELGFNYGSDLVPAGSRVLAIVDGKQVARRDHAAEQAAAEQLAELGLQPFQGNPSSYRVPARRLLDTVSALLDKKWLVELEGNKVRHPGAFEMSITSGVDWFDLSASLEYDDTSATLPAILRAARDKSRPFVQLADGSQGMLPKTWLARYEKLLRLGKVDGDKLKFTSAQGLLLDALIEEQRDARVDQTFATLRKQLEGATKVAPSKEPKAFRGKLRPYQRKGLGWLKFLQKSGFGGCLADDMGLGKTVQVLALLVARQRSRKRSDPPSLVVVPRSLVHNWIDEAARFAPGLRVIDYTGSTRNRQAVDSADLVVTTYGTLRQDIDMLRVINFDYVILDEAMAMKNATGQTAKACRVLLAEHRLAMTGTPVENHLGELGSVFEFLNPGMLDPKMLRELSRDFSANSTASDTIELLARSLRPFLLRRTKDQVLRDLPRKTEQTLFCQLGTEQRETYDELKVYYQRALDKRIATVGFKRSGIQILEALLRLRQAACHPGLIDDSKRAEGSAKLDTLLEQLLEVIEGGHKVLVFSQFTKFLALVRARLDDHNVTYAYLDGKTANRKRVVERFQTDDNCRVFLISLKAGGHGLNLTASDYVFLLDPWWNPAVEAQAIDRAHRIGQKNPVFAYRLVAQDTVEEKILELQEKKRALANSIYTGSGGALSSMTPEDVKHLLS